MSGASPITVAALYVETNGCYFDLPGVVIAGHGEDHADGTTTIHLDGRTYAGPCPVVAHPVCKRWGRFWHGSTRKPHQFKLGDDGGICEHALKCVREFGGVFEHPADSKAWAHFNLNRPPREGGWVPADMFGGWTCCVDPADLPELIWGRGAQRLHPVALEKHGYAKARKIGMMAMVGGKDKVRIRNATPPLFRDVLLSLARTAHMGTVPTKGQVEADEAPGVANPCVERPDREGSLPSAPCPLSALTDAHEIVAGAWAPWLDNPHVATPAEWLPAAQCCLDGDDSDLRHFLDRMDEPGEPMNGDYEFYKHEAAVARLSQPINTRKAA